MKVFVAVMLVSAVWLVLAFALAGCGGRKSSAPAHALRPSLPGGGAEPWMCEQHGSVVSLRQTGAVPPNHPVSRWGA
jgi:hypothetical protein